MLYRLDQKKHYLSLVQTTLDTSILVLPSHPSISPSSHGQRSLPTSATRRRDKVCGCDGSTLAVFLHDLQRLGLALLNRDSRTARFLLAHGGRRLQRERRSSSRSLRRHCPWSSCVAGHDGSRVIRLVLLCRCRPSSRRKFKSPRDIIRHGRILRTVLKLLVLGRVVIQHRAVVSRHLGVQSLQPARLQ